ncbi:MAG TPA: anthranilate phosphoribosyltransferase [Acidimicrobiales bacterium]|jgi:anthranilate phosphoribosyltransferase|nr:anthranilate phosphoribosyltransferase [Acidimicrobiales bacterium]
MDESATIDDLGGWPSVLARLVAGDTLSGDEAAAILSDVLAGNATAAQVASFVTALRLRGETVEEMAGLVRAMLAHAESVAVSDHVSARLVDTCGTGGDRRHTVNVSTIAALVVAGAGVPVCKHGGRAASSASGSADVLEALGVVIDLGPEGVARCIDEVGMGFCFAPRFHPAMRHAGAVRRELGVATVFNFLGPLANPARVRRQVVGVSDPAMAHKMLGVLATSGAARAMVVWGHDGLDELSIAGPSTALCLEADNAIRRMEVYPPELGLDLARPAEVLGGDAAANAEVVHRVLEGVTGPHRDIVVLNAAAGLVVAGVADDLTGGVARARAALDDGSAAAVLEGLVRVSRSAAGRDR